MNPVDPKLHVVGLLAGEPGAQELWTLRALTEGPCRLSIVQAKNVTLRAPWQRLRAVIRKAGWRKGISRLLGRWLLGRDQERESHAVLEALFDGVALRDWWRAAGLTPQFVTHLNHDDCVARLKALQPDLLVRISGGVLQPPVFTQARLAALNIHHGLAPAIRGMWSIPWGLVENRADWIGVTVHEIDKGIDTGRVLRQVTPQLAPGDTDMDLFFRGHLEAVEALVDLVRQYAAGHTPASWPVPMGESAYRSAPGLGDRLRLHRIGRGVRATVLLERALR